MLVYVKLTSRCFPQTYVHLAENAIFFAFDFTIFLISNVFTQSEECALSLPLFKEESLGRGRGVIRSVLKKNELNVAFGTHSDATAPRFGI